MYNRALDTFKAVTEKGSFSKAAEKLMLTHTAVIKQMNSLEGHLGVELFTRSNQGVQLTAAGQVLYAEALQLMKQSEKVIGRVRAAYFAQPKTLRIGTSLMYPIHSFMDLWDTIRVQRPDFQLKVVSLNSDKSRLEHLGVDVDFLVGPYNLNLPKSVRFMPVGEYRFHVAVPRGHDLAKKEGLSFKELAGFPLMIMKTGNSAINDAIRREIVTNHPEINLLDIDSSYDIATFNRCVEHNVPLLSLECWDRVHPDVRSIPLRENFSMPYGIVSTLEPGAVVEEFLGLLKKNTQK